MKGGKVDIWARSCAGKKLRQARRTAAEARRAERRTAEVMAVVRNDQFQCSCKMFKVKSGVGG